MCAHPVWGLPVTGEAAGVSCHCLSGANEISGSPEAVCAARTLRARVPGKDLSGEG